MRANHSQNCGKGFARLVMMPISKLNLCKAELKKQKLIESEPFQRLRKRSRPPRNDVHFQAKVLQGGTKRLARLVLTFISKLNLCKAVIK